MEPFFLQKYNLFIFAGLFCIVSVYFSHLYCKSCFEEYKKDYPSEVILLYTTPPVSNSLIMSFLNSVVFFVIFMLFSFIPFKEFFWLYLLSLLFIILITAISLDYIFASTLITKSGVIFCKLFSKDKIIRYSDIKNVQVRYVYKAGDIIFLTLKDNSEIKIIPPDSKIRTVEALIAGGIKSAK